MKKIAFISDIDYDFSIVADDVERKGFFKYASALRSGNG